MRTFRNDEGEICIIVTEDELDDLRGDIWQVHGEYCVSSDNCRCSERSSQLDLSVDAVA